MTPEWKKKCFDCFHNQMLFFPHNSTINLHSLVYWLQWMYRVYVRMETYFFFHFSFKSFYFSASHTQRRFQCGLRNVKFTVYFEQMFIPYLKWMGSLVLSYSASLNIFPLVSTGKPTIKTCSYHSSSYQTKNILRLSRTELDANRVFLIHLKFVSE